MKIKDYKLKNLPKQKQLIPDFDNEEMYKISPDDTSPIKVLKDKCLSCERTIKTYTTEIIKQQNSIFDYYKTLEINQKALKETTEALKLIANVDKLEKKFKGAKNGKKKESKKEGS